MVDQSDLPFRLLCRSHGANLAYTPMIHAKMFLQSRAYRDKFWQGSTPAEDRPLFAQFCGGNAENVLAAARAVQGGVDAVDLNCGCPQNIARRGNYGAFLLEKPELVDLVRTLSRELDVPVTVKVRLLPQGLEASLDPYARLVEAGAAAICVHGRNRHQKGSDVGSCDWEAIAAVVADPRVGGLVPVLANGGIGSAEDAHRCLEETKADGVLSSEAILEYPPLFSAERRIGRCAITREYLRLCDLHPPDRGGQGSGIKCVKMHLHRFLHADLQTHPVLRERIANAGSLDDLREVLDDVEEIHVRAGHQDHQEVLSWYVRYTRIVPCDDGLLRTASQRKQLTNEKEHHASFIDSQQDGDCFAAMFGDY